MADSKFEILDDREHVLRRSSMYVGSTTLEPIAGIIDFQYQSRHLFLQVFS